MIGGYSSNPWAARIISEVWVQIVRLDIHIHFERVSSKENISDGPSRNDFGLVGTILQFPREDARLAIREVAAMLKQNTALLFGAAAAQSRAETAET